MENRDGGPNSNRERQYLSIGCIGAASNAVMAYAIASVTGFSSAPVVTEGTVFFLGIRGSDLPYVALLSVPASIFLLVSFRKAGRPGLGLAVSLLYLGGILWMLYTGFSAPYRGL